MTNRGEDFSHEALDALPNVSHVMHLRAALVYAGVLAERDEHIERTVPWIERFLGTQPAHVAAVLRPYAVWSVLRRTRVRARRRVAGRGASKYVRNLIVLAAELMKWLDDRSIDLPDLSQGDVDEWLVGGGVNRQRVRDFLRWAATPKLIPLMRIPVAARTQPDAFLLEKQRWECLSRCAHDQALGLEVRVSAAPVLLFGLTPTRIVRLTVDDITTRGDAVLLLIGKSPLPLTAPSPTWSVNSKPERSRVRLACFTAPKELPGCCSLAPCLQTPASRHYCDPHKRVPGHTDSSCPKHSSICSRQGHPGPRSLPSSSGSASKLPTDGRTWSSLVGAPTSLPAINVSLADPPKINVETSMSDHQ